MEILRLALAAALLLAAPHVAWSQAYPARPVRVVVGFTPGAGADLVARIVAAKMSDALGQPVIVENKPGAGSNIAAEGVARAAPDGYTLFLGTVANAINASLARNLSFDFGRDFAPIAALATVPNVLVVHPDLGVRTVQELVAAARARPGAILFGSSGNGTSPHLAGELFNLMAGVKLVHVPYKGSPQAAADLLAGRVQAMFAPASTVLPHIKAGKLVALASSGITRGSQPELPTIAESGLAGYESSVWFGLVAPAATPAEIVERLNREAVRALAAADTRSQLTAQGLEPMGGTPSDFAAHIRRETEKWARVVQASGAKAD